MGRAERRRQEKKERVETRKGKILLTRKELGAWKEKVAQDTSDYNVQSLMTCFALAQVRLYADDQDRVFNMLQYVDELMGEILEDPSVINDFVTELKNAGVIVSCD